MQFRDKSIIITGASSGIGEALALEFASRGGRLHLVARRRDRLEEVASACRKLASSVTVYCADMSDTASIDAFCEDFEARGDRLDVLVLNAGISQRSLALDTGIDVCRKIMETDFFGPAYLTQKLSRHIREAEDFRIAVTSSISGLFGFPLRSSYCAAKHALFGFFETVELENPSVRVTFIIPGRINTPISRSAVQADGSAYARMDPGQEGGVSARKCAGKAVRAIARGRRRVMIGGIELIMVWIKRLCPGLFFRLAGKVSSV